MMSKCNAAGSGRYGRYGRLQVFQNEGESLKQVYAEFDHDWNTEMKGASHAKVFFKWPYLIVGSTNWTVASRANVELSCLMKIHEPTRAYVNQFIRDMRRNERIISLAEIQELAKAALDRRRIDEVD